MQSEGTARSERAIIYAAKSTEDKRGSIPDQLADCRGMAEREGWEVVAEFTDEAFSAWKGDRGPGLADARALAEESAPCILLAQHSDRFARGAGDAPGAAQHLGEVLFWARRHGVELRSVQDAQTFDNPLMAFVMGERNAEDSRRKSEAVKGGMRRRAERGKTNGGPTPYGYRWQGPKGEQGLVPHEAEASIVRRIFSEFTAGNSQQSIGRGLNADGIRSQKGGEWFQGTIAKVLANPAYVGRVRFHGTVHEGTHPPLVAEETFEQATGLREATARTKGGGRGRLPKGGHLFVRGLLRCGICDGAMIPTTKPTRTKGSLYTVYECHTRKRLGTAHCPQEPVPRAIVDKAVVGYFAKVALDVEATRRDIEAASDRKAAETRTLREQAERELLAARERLARVKRALQDGHLDPADYAEQRTDLVAEQEAAQASVERLREQEAQAAQAIREDAEGETLRYLAELRAAVASGIQNASGVEALRAALVQLFDGFTFCRVSEFGSLTGSKAATAEYLIEPHIRPGLEAGHDEQGRVVPQRVALPVSGINDAVGLAT